MSARITVRPVRPTDVPAVVAMVHELAAFELAADQCHLTDDQLSAALFDPAATVFAHVAETPDDGPVGFALWFLNYSTWEGTSGIHLEDLYVRPAARGTGAGRELLAALAALCVQRGYRRLEWVMLSWNPARDFYAAMGATVVQDWLPYRVSGPALSQLAQRSTVPGCIEH